MKELRKYLKSAMWQFLAMNPRAAQWHQGSKEDQRTRNGTEGFVGMSLVLRTRWVSHADVVRNPGGSQLTRAHCCHEAQRPSVVL